MSESQTLQAPIEIEVYRPVKGKPGYSELDYRRPVKEVIAELNRKLRAEDPELFDESSFSDMTSWDSPNGPWPAWRWIAVFPVTGGSEGHYIHIETIGRDDARTSTMIALCKTFRGWDHACRIAAAAGRLLQA